MVKYSWYKYYDVEVKRWLREHRLVKLHKRLGHALALPSLAGPLAKALRLFVQLDETQSHWIPFDLYIILLHNSNCFVSNMRLHVFRKVLWQQYSVSC